MNFQATIVYEKNWDAINKPCETCKGTGLVSGVSCVWCGDGETKFKKGSTKHYRYIINEGSSRSSKTVSLIDILDTYARSQLNKRMTVWRDTKTDCKKTVLNDALKRFKTTGRYKVGQEFNKTESIFTYDTGSTFEIHGTDDEETVHGLTQDVAWKNEPYKISRDTFDQIDQRTSDFVILDLNPKKDHWADDIKKHPRALVIHSTFKDNPFCPIEAKKKILSYQPIKMCAVVLENKIKEHEAKVYNIQSNPLNFTKKEINELTRCIGNEERNTANEFNWQVYGLGTKAERPHRVFHWEEIPLSKYYEIKAKTYNGVDWGKVDPFGILEAKYYDGGLYLHEINYESEDKLKAKLSESERNQISSLPEGFIMWFFNKLGINKGDHIACDTNRPEKIRALRDAGYDYAFGAYKGAGSIVDGVDGLSSIKVYYTSSSTNLKYEQENYSRSTDRYGKVIDGEFEDLNNHLIDPARYIYQFLRREGIIRNV